MVQLITIHLPDAAVAKLRDLAERDFRRPRDVAGLLVVEGLERRELEAGSKASAGRPAGAGPKR